MPVLPLVASMTVCPRLSCPASSAASITPSAKRSLTEPKGLNASILTKRFTSVRGVRLLILTVGVLPIVPRMLSNFAMQDPMRHGSVAHDARLSNGSIAWPARLLLCFVQMLWGWRRGHGTFGAVQRLPKEFPHVATLSF